MNLAHAVVVRNIKIVVVNNKKVRSAVMELSEIKRHIETFEAKLDQLRGSL